MKVLTVQYSGNKDRSRLDYRAEVRDVMEADDYTTLEDLNTAIDKLETILEPNNRNKIENITGDVCILSDKLSIDRYTGVCFIIGRHVEVTLKFVLSQSFVGGTGDLVYPVCYHKNQQSLWRNPLRWKYAEHCLIELKKFRSLLE